MECEFSNCPAISPVYCRILESCHESINLNKLFKILTNLRRFHIVDTSLNLEKVQIIQYFIPRPVCCETKLAVTKNIHFYCSNERHVRRLWSR
jgi:hypothetical protein